MKPTRIRPSIRPRGATGAPPAPAWSVPFLVPLVRLVPLLLLLVLAVPAAAQDRAAQDRATPDPAPEAPVPPVEEDLDHGLPELPPIPEDAVELQVQEELEAAARRIRAALAAAGEGRAADLADRADAEAPEVVAVDLAGAVALALERNPSLLAVEEQRDEVRAGVQEVKADAYPQLAATSSYSISRNPAFLNSPDFEDIIDQFPGGDFRPGEQELYAGGIEITQPVYTFGKIRAAIDLARLVVDVTEAQIGAARLDTALAAGLAYYDVLAAREALVVGVVQHQVRREALEVVRARYEIGEATRLELLRAQSAVAEVTPEIARQAGDLEVARNRLRNVLGLPQGARLAVTGGLDVDLPALGRLPETADGPAVERVQEASGEEERPGDRWRREGGLPPVPDFATLWDAARRNRPEIADLELQAEVLERRQVVTRAGGRPQVEFTGFYGREARLVENLEDDLFENYAFAIGLRWEFFDGGRREGQIAQLESQRQQLGHQLRDLLDAIQLEIEQSLSAYRTARERWRAAETAATAAREASRVARESYREGVALQTDWLDAQRQEAEAEILAVEAYYQARQEAARLARALGAYPTEERLAEALVEAEDRPATAVPETATPENLAPESLAPGADPSLDAPDPGPRPETDSDPTDPAAFPAGPEARP